MSSSGDGIEGEIKQHETVAIAGELTKKGAYNDLPDTCFSEHLCCCDPGWSCVLCMQAEESRQVWW